MHRNSSTSLNPATCLNWFACEAIEMLTTHIPHSSVSSPCLTRNVWETALPLKMPGICRQHTSTGFYITHKVTTPEEGPKLSVLRRPPRPPSSSAFFPLTVTEWNRHPDSFLHFSELIWAPFPLCSTEGFSAVFHLCFLPAHCLPRKNISDGRRAR